MTQTIDDLIRLVPLVVFHRGNGTCRIYGLLQIPSQIIGETACMSISIRTYLNVILVIVLKALKSAIRIFNRSLT
ncbi:hypothetical protein D3C85_1000120 [compost metagenome]